MRQSILAFVIGCLVISHGSGFAQATQNIRSQQLLFAGSPSLPVSPNDTTGKSYDFRAASSGYKSIGNSSKMAQHEGVAHIEDALGNIIAYIGGGEGTYGIYDANKTAMTGSTPWGGSATEAETNVCPNPANSNQWYVFYRQTNGSTGPAPILYCMVDFSLNGGLGDVAAGTLNTTLSSGNNYAEAGEVIEIKDKTTGIGTGNFYFLAIESGTGLVRWTINSSGIGSKTTLYSFTTSGNNLDNRPLISMEYTNGTLAWTTMIGDKIYFGTFDNTNDATTGGTYTNHANSPLTTTGQAKTPYGIEISPDGTKIYVSFENSVVPFTDLGPVWQYDLNNAPTLNPYKVINGRNGGMLTGSMELAINGVIYATVSNSPYIYRIQNPNTAGAGANPTTDTLNAARGLGLSDPIQWAAGTTPLPIELLSFKGYGTTDGNRIEWITCAEVNNDYFTLERSNNAINFYTVATIKGAGTSRQQHLYSHTDVPPAAGIWYYRLKQTDFDGQFEYFKVIAVSNDAQNGFAFDVFPNPTHGKPLHIDFSQVDQATAKQVLVVLYDITGQEVYSTVMMLEESGEHVFAIDPSGRLAKGVYMITASSEEKQYRRKLIIN